jgi:hypothetical protein
MAAGWFAASIVTMLMIWLACALAMLAVLADAACSAATANSAG